MVGDWVGVGVGIGVGAKVGVALGNGVGIAVGVGVGWEAIKVVQPVSRVRIVTRGMLRSGFLMMVMTPVT